MFSTLFCSAFLCRGPELFELFMKLHEPLELLLCRATGFIGPIRSVIDTPVLPIRDG